MLIDANLPPVSLKDVPAIARAAERIGFDALWSAETRHDPFLPGALVAGQTSRLKFGTAIAVAFARSPTTLAYTAWDLAEALAGRFILGLGTQVKGHIERRFGMPWPESPVKKLREQISILRGLWRTWQTGEPLNLRGEYYKITMMSPFFNPGPIEHPDIPIYIAGVNTGLADLAGEAADGFVVHPFHSPAYLKEAILPAVQAGARKAEKTRTDRTIFVTAITAAEPEETEFARQQIAFYASTPSYRPVMALHGWEEVAERLSSLASRRLWNEMPALISDQMLEVFVTHARPGDLAAALAERYQGLADRLSLYIPFMPGERDHFWKSFIRTWHDEIS
jgi:probable F420-dependent oxidoreductase